MARDKLDVLLRVRQQTVDQGQQRLAACLKAETAAAQAIEAIDDAVRRERAFAESAGFAAAQTQHPLRDGQTQHPLRDGQTQHPLRGQQTEHALGRHGSVVMWSAWLIAIRKKRIAAVADLATAQRQTAQGRAFLASARLAARAVEQLQQERALAARMAADARDAHALDDVARSQFGFRALMAAATGEGNDYLQVDKQPDPNNGRLVQDHHSKDLSFRY